MSGRARRESRGPTLWVLAFLAIAIGGGLFVLGGAASRGRSFERYSTHRAEPDGTLALHDWLKAISFEPRRETEELVLLPDDGSLLVLVGIFDEDEVDEPLVPKPGALPKLPKETLGKAELGAIGRWVEEGGRLLILDAHRNPLYERFQIGVKGIAAKQEHEQDTPALPATPVALSPYTRQAKPLETRAQTGLVPPLHFVPLFASEDGRVLATSGSVGKGEVIAVSDPWIATNDGIRKSGNAEFLLAVAASGRSRVVRFDERRHGFSAQRNVMGFVQRFGLDAAAIQALALFGLIIWAAGRPATRPRVPPAREGVESREFVSAMANIYSRMGLHGHALETYYRRAERALIAALRSRGVTTSPLPDDETIRSELRALGVQNWSGWEFVRQGYLDLRGSIGRGGKRPGFFRRLFARDERQVLSYARFAARFEHEVRAAAKVPLDEVVA